MTLELRPITPTEDHNGISRVMEDTIRNVQLEVTLPFDPIDGSDPAEYGISATLWRANGSVVFDDDNVFTSNDRDSLIRTLREDESVVGFINYALDRLLEESGEQE